MKSWTKTSVLASLLFAGMAGPSSAIIDKDGDGMSDVWEGYYGLNAANSGDAAADLDGDGWTNLDEAIAGTDPASGQQPDGFLQAHITQNPIVPGVFLVSWATFPGKQYKLQVSPTLGAGTWAQVGDAEVGDGTPIEVAIDLTGNPTPPTKLFWRVTVADAETDTDSDGLNDFEEFLAFTRYDDPDSDHDGLPDGWEVAAGIDPNDDGLINPVNGPSGLAGTSGTTNYEHYLSGTFPFQSASSQDVWVSVSGDGEELQSRNKSFEIPAGQTRLILVRISSAEYPEYTSPNAPTQFNDQVTWEVSLSTEGPIQGEIGVVELHDTLAQSGRDYCIVDAKCYTAPDNQSLTITVSVSSLNVDDPQRPSTVSVGCLPIGLLGDTNRDGAISSNDSPGKDKWVKEKGAIYSVNFDNDNPGAGAGNDNDPDAITWWNNEGVPSKENWKIENQDDLEDISPFLIEIPGLPFNTDYYLTTANNEEVKAVHIYGRREVGKDAIWGSFLDAGKPWTDDDSNQKDIKISSWLNGQPGENKPGSKGVYELGLEGLLFRGMKVPNGTLPNGRFGGVIELGLEIKHPDIRDRIKCGTIKLKVAPFLLNGNDRPAESAFIYDIRDFTNNPLGLQGMPSEVLLNSGLPTFGTAVSQWVQDHAEIGFTQRPGGPITKMTFVAPYEGKLATWPVEKLFKKDQGVFAFGGQLGGLAGDHGGNIELSHPDINNPLGRILLGSSASLSIKEFLAAQEGQPLTLVNVDYAEVKHIDEVVSTGPSSKYYVPDPAAAIALLQTSFPTDQSRLEGVFFSKDAEKAKVTTVLRTQFSAQKKFIITDLNYATNHQAWEPYAAGYLRLVGSGNCAGQIAKISAIAEAVAADDPNNGAAVIGKLKFVVNEVWDTKVLENGNAVVRVNRKWNSASGASQQDWYQIPQAGTKVVCVKTSLEWRSQCPAIITVKEVLGDSSFVNFNSVTAPPLISASATAAGVSNSVGLPSLYYEQSSAPVSWVAFTPGVVNLQWVNDIPVLPNVFGPRNSNNEDVFFLAYAQKFGSVAPVYLNDWDSFHVYSGEVHCGSGVSRTPSPDWWNK